MIESRTNLPGPPADTDAASGTESPADVIARAEEFGVDISLLRSNLRLTPTERLLRLQGTVASLCALQADARAWRKRRKATL